MVVESAAASRSLAILATGEDNDVDSPRYFWVEVDKNLQG